MRPANTIARGRTSAPRSRRDTRRDRRGRSAESRTRADAPRARARILMQRVERRCHEGRRHHALYYAIMQASPPHQSSSTGVATNASRAALDRHVRDVIEWHFDPSTGSPFWLEFAKKAGWDPRREIG